MEPLGINKTMLNQFISFLSENQCIKCQDNSTSAVTVQDEDPVRLTYILILMCSLAFFTLVMMYWRISSKQQGHSKDPYHIYIVGQWKTEEQLLVSDRSTTLTIGNQAVVDTHMGAEAAST